MTQASFKHSILAKIRAGLGKKTEISENSKTELVYKDYTHQNRLESEDLVSIFTEEALKVSAKVKTIGDKKEIPKSIEEVFRENGYKRFAIWNSQTLKSLRVKELLSEKGFRAVSNNKEELIEADVGITEVDFAIADTGTLVLLTDSTKPRSVSLIPHSHIAVVESKKIVANIFELFTFLPDLFSSSKPSCLTFITGPSRTADIELTLTIGAHGPKNLFVLIY
ncbi:Lactate utilization protein C [bacterium HR37]|jgi:L-lactate dehydrogenase complex protein LldG|nr:Lactate utilization protein C [bacterium HR37]